VCDATPGARSDAWRKRRGPVRHRGRSLDWASRGVEGGHRGAGPSVGRRRVRQAARRATADQGDGQQENRPAAVAGRAPVRCRQDAHAVLGRRRPVRRSGRVAGALHAVLRHLEWTLERADGGRAPAGRRTGAEDVDSAKFVDLPDRGSGRFHRAPDPGRFVPHRSACRARGCRGPRPAARAGDEEACAAGGAPRPRQERRERNSRRERHRRHPGHPGPRRRLLSAGGARSTANAR